MVQAMISVSYTHLDVYKRQRRESERIIKELRRQTSRLMERERTLLAETARADLGKMQELIHDNLRLEEEVTQAEEEKMCIRDRSDPKRNGK